MLALVGDQVVELNNIDLELREHLASFAVTNRIELKPEDLNVPIEWPTYVAAPPRQKHPPKPPRNPFKSAQPRGR